MRIGLSPLLVPLSGCLFVYFFVFMSLSASISVSFSLSLSFSLNFSLFLSLLHQEIVRGFRPASKAPMQLAATGRDEMKGISVDRVTEAP